jgi:hypothetical protein
MDKARMDKETFESKAFGKINSGKVQIEGLENVMNDVRELKVKRWRQKANR